MSATARSGPRRRGRAACALAAALAAACLGAPPARAQSPRGSAPAWVSLGVLGGSTLADPRLADFAWDTRPRAAWGASAAAGRGPFALHLDAWRSTTTQALGLSGAPASADVHSTSLELLARARVAAWHGTRVALEGGGGRLRLDWSPDHVAIPGVGKPIDVAFTPVDAWLATGGVALERALPGRWVAGVACDRRFFSLDTAHRDGAAVEDERRSFGEWNARFELARRFSLTGKGAW